MPNEDTVRTPRTASDTIWVARRTQHNTASSLREHAPVEECQPCHASYLASLGLTLCCLASKSHVRSRFDDVTNDQQRHHAKHDQGQLPSSNKRDDQRDDHGADILDDDTNILADGGFDDGGVLSEFCCEGTCHRLGRGVVKLLRHRRAHTTQGAQCKTHLSHFPPCQRRQCFVGAGT